MRKRVLIISNISWDFVWQRHQTIATLFAADHDVTFLEVPGVRRVGWRDAFRILSRMRALLAHKRNRPDGGTTVHVLRPWVLPATNSVFIRWNRGVLRRRLRPMREGVEIIIAYSPTRAALDVAEFVPHRQLIYDCTDNWAGVRGVPSQLLCAERELLSRATLTLVPSQRLMERHRGTASRIELLPHGALVERFRSVADHPPPSAQMTLLYYGHIHRQHLDLEAVVGLAGRRPEWRLVLVGPVKTRMRFPVNVHLTGQVPHENLAAWISRANVLLLPYVINEYTACVLPAKTFECLATGRPIVAAPLPELVSRFGSVMSFAQTVSEYEAAVCAVHKTDTAEAKAHRISLAEANTWDARYDQLQRWLKEPPPSPG